MVEKQEKKYERRISPLERMFTRSTFSKVTVVARIKGKVTENMVKNAASKAQQRHPLLRVKIKVDENQKRIA